MPVPSHSSSSSSPHAQTATGQTPFRSLPQKYPQAMRAAAQVAAGIHGIVRKSPRSLVATVIDTTYQVTQGYVLCTTQHGIVKVYAVPYGSVVPQMRLFARQAGPMSNTRDFVFDGMAPGISVRNQASGALLYATSAADALSSSPVLAQTSAGAVPTVTALNSGVGYYWHLFFYAPALPAKRATLFCMNYTTNNILCLDLLSTGLLSLVSVENGNGYTTTKPVAPHSIHWVVIQVGLGGGNDFLIDGLSYFSTVGGGPSFWGAANPYTLTLLSKNDGSQVCPLGTWVSKVGFGTSYNNGTSSIIPLGVATPAPTADSGLPNLNVSAYQQAVSLSLCENSGSATLTNSAAGGAAGSLNITTAYATQVGPGPY